MKLVYNPKPAYQYYVPSIWTLTRHDTYETVTPNKDDSVIIWNDEHYIEQAKLALPEGLKLEFVKPTVESGGSIYNIT